ncbi:Apc15p protein-domain-containing protein [Apodospora peruviana]|uniref:Apc15p protein-domain-containing protein n=1 Tax=Apodospora peruviana TaxID=516989 RepID=A0AAE0M152_9PEZI|nr:Apc15p protein-domain-containing protein [Apodospora peruviana]
MMFSVLPDLTPRDSHSLWYISSRNPSSSTPSHLDPLHNNPGGLENGPGANGANSGPGAANARNNRPAQAAIIERSVLGRLRADEIYMERRRANVGNLGNNWLKPPGVTKTLFQMREERREAEEHAEAMRREMLAQELAEAEAAGGVGNGTDDPMDALGLDEMEGDDQMMENGENGGGGRDLDADIPDADDGGFGYDGASDDNEEEEEEEEEDEEEELEDSLVDTHGGGNGRQQSRAQQRELANRMASMRATEDRMREMLATRGTAGQGGDVAGDGELYGAGEDIDEVDQAQILEEDDLVEPHGGYVDDDQLGMEDDLDMDANLDDDIPEAESGLGYEHTDSEADLSSDEDDGPSFAAGSRSSEQRHLREHQQQLLSGGGRSSSRRISSSGPYALPPHPRQYQQQQNQLPPQQQRNRSSLASRGDGNGQQQQLHRSSLDFSGLLSMDGSSVVGSSSPHIRRNLN